MPDARKILPLLLAAAAVFTAAQSRADVNAIRAEDNAMEFAIGASDLAYREQAAGATLDSENGAMPSFDLGVTMLSPDRVPWPFLRDIYFHLDGRFDIGSTDYDGAICSGGVCTPHTTTTNDRIFTLDTQLGRAFTLDRNFMLTPLVDLGYRIWDRDITGTGGYSETYENGEALAGALLQYSPDKSRMVFSLSAEGGTTFSPTMSTPGERFVLVDSSGNIIAVLADTFKLQPEPMWKIGAKFGYALSRDWEATASFNYTGFSYGASQVIGGVVSEPDSNSSQFTAMLGIAWHFDAGWYQRTDDGS